MDEEINIKNELIKRLKTLSEDRDFLLSVVNAAWYIEDRKKIIEFVDIEKEVTYENVILLALTLYEERDQTQRGMKNELS